MLQNKYQPYRYSEGKHSIKSQTDLSTFQPLTVAFVDKGKVKKQTIMIWYDRKNVTLLIRKKKTQSSIKFQSAISNIVYVSSTKLAAFDSQNGTFQLIDIDQCKNMKILIEENPAPEDSFSQLFFFNNIQQFCIVSQSKDKTSTNLAFYSYKDDTIKFKQDHLISEPAEKVWQLNEDGMILLSNQNQNNIDLHLYCCEGGYRCFRKIENLSKGNSIAYAFNHLNQIHLVMETKDNPGEGLPIIIVQTKDNLSNFVKVSQPEQKNSKKVVSTIINAFNVNGLVLLQTSEDKKQQPLFYSPERQQIVEVLNTSFEDSAKLSTLTFIQNQVIEWIEEEKKQISLRLHQIDKVNSLSVMKMLEALETIKTESKDQQTAVLIFGDQGTGKSTLRHFLCQDEVVHELNQLGFNEVRLKNPPVTHYAASPEKDKIIGISKAHSAIIIEVPYYSDQPFYEAEIYVLMQAVYKNFKKMHTVLTISQQYIDDSHKNQQLMANTLKMINTTNQDVAKHISVVLTKISDEDYFELFQEKIEEIIELSEQNQSSEPTGAIYKAICDAQHIYLFSNKQYQKQEGKELLDKILQSDYLVISQNMSASLQQVMLKRQQLKQATDLILSESCFYYRSFDKVLKFICSLTVGEPSYFDLGYFTHNVFHLGKGFIQNSKKNENKSALIRPLFNVLVCLKLFVEKSQNRNSKVIQQLNELFKQLIIQFGKESKQEEVTYLKTLVQLFLEAVTFPSQFLNIDQGEAQYKIPVCYFQSYSESILSKYFIQTVNRIIECQPELKESAEMQLLAPFMKKGKKVKSLVISKKVPMSYEEQKQSYLKQKNIVQTICDLPANVMKLDLMIDQLEKISPKGVTDANMQETRFYLKQCSRVCHFHKQYFEAIVFLLVIPDFYGIDLLLDQLVQYARERGTYHNKSIFTTLENEMIDELLKLCQDCARQTLLRKLVLLKCLEYEARGEQQLKEKEAQYMKKYLGATDKSFKDFQQRLRNHKDLPFYNLENSSFKKLLEGREQLIKQCLSYETDPKTRKAFEKIQALNWLIENTPLPQ